MEEWPVEQWYRAGYQEWCHESNAAEKAAEAAAVVTANAMGKFYPFDYGTDEEFAEGIEKVRQAFNSWVAAQEERVAVMARHP